MGHGADPASSEPKPCAPTLQQAQGSHLEGQKHSLVGPRAHSGSSQGCLRCCHIQSLLLSEPCPRMELTHW